MMELRHLLTFLAVAETQSFTRAAERLGTSQSAVSATVRRLEEELEAPLFDRTTHRVDLTDAGRALVPEARGTLAAAAAAREAVDQVRGGLRGTVRLGVMQAQATGPVSTAAFVAAFRRDHAAVHVELRQAGSAVLADMVRDGRLDLAVLGNPAPLSAPPAGLALTELASEPMALACHAGHRFASWPAIDLATVAAEPAADLPPGWSMRTANDRVFAAAGLRRRLEYEVNDSSSIVDLVRHGLAVALIPASLVGADDGSIATVPLTGAPDHAHRVALAVPTGRPLGLAAQALRDTILGGGVPAASHTRTRGPALRRPDPDPRGRAADG
ncbi:HTH-type transcriptional regulator GltC [Paraconexibacter sp. AEG42_29]|uniref:HTH-type transcriptional regulator GltC n=1 Tax=Paraconexibacter sp. AEG42_29 TaxID=2997339 RepID=A0AAU7B3B0_9ACTN